MIKNLSEEHVFAAYDRLRPSFPQFCGCDMCRGDVLIYALNRVQARYVNTLAGSVMTELNLEKDQNGNDKHVVKTAIGPDHKDYAALMGAPRPAAAPQASAQAPNRGPVPTRPSWAQ